MSSFLCFVCHSTVNADTNEEIREKYRDVIGMNLCPDSHLCHICCHFLNKICMFKSICLRRSLEDPVFSEKGTINLQKSDTQVTFLCPEDCIEHLNSSNHLDNDFDNDNDSVTEYFAEDESIELEKKKDEFEKIVLTIEEQKKELENNRKIKKYVDSDFKCHSCAMGFLFKDSYQAHMMRHEESNGEYRCNVCKLRFANPAVLRSHLANHAERYKCTTCQVIVRARQRQTHIVSCRGSETASVSCHLCGNTFQSVSHFHQHLKRFHQSKNSLRTYSCNVCGKTYNNQAAVRTHMLTHVNKKFTCETCNSIFSSPYTLNQHKKKHYNTEIHNCSTCNISFNSRKNLLAHLKNTLAHKDTVYKCSICGRTCPSLNSLNSHISAIHERSKNLGCHLCPARYSTRKGLVRHMLSHKADARKQTPLCHACGEKFTSTSILKRHLKNVCEKDKIDDLCNYYSQEQ